MSESKKKPQESDLDKNDRFLSIERELYCIGCKSLVNRLEYFLHGSKSESDVVFKMSDICTSEKLKKSPYRMYNFDRQA